jgi:hypothetical protein
MRDGLHYAVIGLHTGSMFASGDDGRVCQVRWLSGDWCLDVHRALAESPTTFGWRKLPVRSFASILRVLVRSRHTVGSTESRL